MITGSLKMMFILTQSISLDTQSKEKVLAAGRDLVYGVMNIKLNGEDIILIEVLEKAATCIARCFPHASGKQCPAKCTSFIPRPNFQLFNVSSILVV